MGDGGELEDHSSVFAVPPVEEGLFVFCLLSCGPTCLGVHKELVDEIFEP